MRMRHLAVAAAGLFAAALVGSLDGSAQAPDARTITLKETERGATSSAVDHPRGRRPASPSATSS